MNCKLCQKELDAYREGRLPLDMKTLIEAHLKECKECAAIYKMDILADRVIDQEKNMESNPFLSTRIMAGIEDIETASLKKEPVFSGIMRPGLMMISLTAAIFLGILFGNISRPALSENTIPVELALMDDVAMESVDLLTNE
jgi:predicted anti-sigma-YlaC factor YlaD